MINEHLYARSIYQRVLCIEGVHYCRQLQLSDGAIALRLGETGRVTCYHEEPGFPCFLIHFWFKLPGFPIPDSLFLCKDVTQASFLGGASIHQDPPFRVKGFLLKNFAYLAL